MDGLFPYVHRYSCRIRPFFSKSFAMCFDCNVFDEVLSPTFFSFQTVLLWFASLHITVLVLLFLVSYLDFVWQQSLSGMSFVSAELE